MKLDKAEEKDIKLIQELAKESWQDAYREILSQPQITYMLGMMYSEETISNHLRSNNYYYYIVRDEMNVPVGFIGYEHHYEPQTTKLHRIYFIPKGKGKGFGKITIDFLKEQTKKNGDTKIILNVNKCNSSKEFYEQRGFHYQSEGVFDIGNGYVMDDYILELTL